MCYGPSSNHRKCRAGVYTCHESTMGKIRHLTRTYCIRKNSYLLNYSLNLTTWATIAFLSHCLTKIFLCPLQESLFLRFYLGRSSKTASSLIYSGAGEEHGIRYRERRRCCMRHTGGSSLSPQHPHRQARVSGRRDEWNAGLSHSNKLSKKEERESP